MKIALIGRRKAGKTTLFNALTGADAPVNAYGGNGSPRVGVARVPDARIDRLSAMYGPRKTVYASVEFVDAPGGTEEEGSRGDSELPLEWIRTTDALAPVLRNFDDGSPGPPDPEGDLEALVDDLILKDLIVAENRLERIAWMAARGKKTAEHGPEEKVLRAVRERLDAGEPVSSMGLKGEDEKRVRGFHFLSAKPMLVLVNSSEYAFGATRGSWRRSRRGAPRSSWPAASRWS